jgi:hypothetical protein
MKILNREIRPDQVNMWVNVISFLIGIIFYIRVEHNFKTKPSLSITPTEQSQIAVVQSNLQIQLSHLQKRQDSIISELQTQKLFVNQLANRNQSIQEKITAIVNADWDKLSKEQKEKYIEQLEAPLPSASPRRGEAEGRKSPSASGISPKEAPLPSASPRRGETGRNDKP